MTTLESGGTTSGLSLAQWGRPEAALPLNWLPFAIAVFLGYNVSHMFHFPALHFSTGGWVAVIAGAFCIGMNKGGLTGLGVLPCCCSPSF